MNLFGWQKDSMSQDRGELPPEVPASAAGRGSKKEVDLFPGLTDRKSLPMVAPRATAAGSQISMFSPVTFDEAIDIVECLRSRAAITLCLENMRKVDASRLVDFVSGASAAIDGDFHKLSEHVYLFCPSNVRITVSDKTPAKGSNGALDFLYSEGSLNAKGSSSGNWTRN